MLTRRSTDEATAWVKSAAASPGAIALALGTCAGLLVVGSYVLLTVRRNMRKLNVDLSEQRARADSAEAGNRSKAEFLISMSHQIRTQLNAIMGFTGLALKSDLTPQLREYLDTARISSDWLMRVATDVLEFSSAESGTLQLDSRLFSLSECAHLALKLVENEIAAKKVTLNCTVDERLPQLVRGDPARLQYVIFNLLDNAVKFTNRASILLLIVLEAETDESLMIRVALNDTGTEFTATLRSSISDPYQQIDASTPAERRGSGFGLAIAKRMVELMGGSMNLQSQLGAGDCFEFTARLGKEPSVAGKTPSQVVTQGPLRANELNVLLADDHSSDRKLIPTILESPGYPVECDSSVKCRTNGEDAVRLAESEVFEASLKDIEMPCVDGAQAIGTIRASEPQADHLHINALSADVSAKDRAQWFDAGMDEFTSKPIELDDPLQRLSNVRLTASGPGTPQQAISLPSHERHALSVFPENAGEIQDAASEKRPDADPVDFSASDLRCADIKVAEEILPEKANNGEISDANEFVMPDLGSDTSIFEAEESGPGSEYKRNAEDLDAIARALDHKRGLSGSFAYSVEPLGLESTSIAALDRSESAVPGDADEAVLAVVQRREAPLPLHTDLPTEKLEGRPIALLPLARPAERHSITAAVLSFQGGSCTNSPPTQAKDWDPFEQARTVLFRSRFDVRVVHHDGDPTNSNLI